MYNPKSISFTNLFSHSATVFTFNANEVTLIHGQNVDVKGANSNGGGKSTIVEAIYLALHGECHRDVDKLNFINKDADDCCIEFTVVNPVINEELIITRNFHRKRSARVEVTINGLAQVQLTSVAEANQFIFDRLGVSKEDLSNHYVISQGNNDTFFTSTDTRQKEIIGRFANFAGVDLVLENVRKQLKVLDKEVQLTEAEIMGKEAVQSNLESMAVDVQLEYADRLREHKSLLLQLQADLVERRGKVKRLQTEATTLDDELKRSIALGQDLTLTRVPLLVYVEQVDNHKATLREYSTSLDNLSRLEVKLNLALAGTITCPKCKTEFLVGLDDGELGLALLQERLAVNLAEQALVRKKLLKRRAKLLAAQVHTATVDELNTQIEDLSRTNRRHQYDLEDITDRVRKLHRAYKEAELVAARTTANPPLKTTSAGGDKIKQQLAATNTQLRELQAALNTLLTQREDLHFWEVNFGTKGFKTYLANQTIGVIEKLVNHSLGKLYTNTQIRMRGYTTLKNGDLRDKITIDVIGADGAYGPYARHSGGEKARVRVAGILALHQLSNLNTGGKGLNLLCLDENFEGLDTQGLQEVLALLAAHKVTTLVITHHTPEYLPSHFKRVVVRKQAGNSTLIPHRESNNPG